MLLYDAVDSLQGGGRAWRSRQPHDVQAEQRAWDMHQNAVCYFRLLFDALQSGGVRAWRSRLAR